MIALHMVKENVKFSKSGTVTLRDVIFINLQAVSTKTTKGGKTQMKTNGARYETCGICGREWSVSVNAEIKGEKYICPHCNYKKKCEKVKKQIKSAMPALEFVIFGVIGIIAFRHAADYALTERGYFAFGGEYLLLFMPLWWAGLRDIVTGTITMCKELRKDKGAEKNYEQDCERN